MPNMTTNLKRVEIRVTLIVESDLEPEAIESELNSHLDSVPGFVGHVVTVVSEEPL